MSWWYSCITVSKNPQGGTAAIGFSGARKHFLILLHGNWGWPWSQSSILFSLGATKANRVDVALVTPEWCWAVSQMCREGFSCQRNWSAGSCSINPGVYLQAGGKGSGPRVGRFEVWVGHSRDWPVWRQIRPFRSTLDNHRDCDFWCYNSNDALMLALSISRVCW